MTFHRKVSVTHKVEIGYEAHFRRYRISISHANSHAVVESCTRRWQEDRYSQSKKEDNCPCKSNKMTEFQRRKRQYCHGENKRMTDYNENNSSANCDEKCDDGRKTILTGIRDPAMANLRLLRGKWRICDRKTRTGEFLQSKMANGEFDGFMVKWPICEVAKWLIFHENGEILLWRLWEHKRQNGRIAKILNWLINHEIGDTIWWRSWVNGEFPGINGKMAT